MFIDSLGKEKKTFVNIFYREFASGVYGSSDLQAQSERLDRQIEHWKSLFSKGKNDVIILGDCNICSDKWDDNDFIYKEQANKIQDFLLEYSCQQIVTSFTRMELSGGIMHKSIIDHCYTDVGEKILGPFVESVGNSD